MRSRNVLMVSALTATLVAGLWLKPKQPRAEAEAVVGKPVETAEVVTAPVALPAQASQPTTQDGRKYPLVPADTAELATLLAAVEEVLRDPATPPEALPDLGHQQQVIYRVLSTDQPRANQVVNALPPRWRSVAERHLAARREFVRMSRGRGPTMLPAWRIIQPEPADKLLSYYQKAEAATGIEWEVLAAVNLVETGMGRIDGVSVANAQGPMQFLPTT